MKSISSLTTLRTKTSPFVDAFQLQFNNFQFAFDIGLNSLEVVTRGIEGVCGGVCTCVCGEEEEGGWGGVRPPRNESSSLKLQFVILQPIRTSKPDVLKALQHKLC